MSINEQVTVVVHAAVNPNPVRYIVIDRHTGAKVAGPFNTRTAASRKVDRLDNAYGAYRYSVRRLGE